MENFGGTEKKTGNNGRGVERKTQINSYYQGEEKKDCRGPFRISTDFVERRGQESLCGPL